MSRVHIIRDSIGKIVNMLTRRRIKVTQRGIQAYVAYNKHTGEIDHVNIPYLADDASDEFIAAVQGFLDHEVGHILFTDQAVVRAAGDEGARVANLHNLMEDTFVERRMAQTFPGCGVNLQVTSKFHLERILRPAINEALANDDKNALMGNVAVAAVRAWAGQAAAADFIATDPAIAAAAQELANIVGDDVVKGVAKIKTSGEALEIARSMLQKLRDHQAAQRAAQQPPAPPPPAPSAPSSQEEEEGDEEQEADEEVPPASDEPAGEPDGSEDPVGQATGDAAPDDADPNAETEDEPELPEASSAVEDEDDAAGGSDEGEDDDSADSGGEGTADDDADTAGGSDPESTPQSGSSRDADEDEPETTASNTASSSGAPAGSADAAPETGESVGEDIFDEAHDYDTEVGKELSKQASISANDAEYIVFSTEWDEQFLAPPTKDMAAVAKLEEDTHNMVGPMQKALERALKSREKKGWLNGQRSGRISPKSLFKTATKDDRLFRRRYEVGGRQVAASLVIDISGSMAYGRIEKAAVAAFALSEVLERLRVPFEVSGFTTRDCHEMDQGIEDEETATGASVPYSRTESLVLPLFKSFDSRFDPLAKQRLALLSSADYHEKRDAKLFGCNVDGESIALAAHRLMQQRAERRVLFVLSDGQPASHGAGGLREHLRRVVKELEAMKIEVVAFGIESAAPKEYYKRFVEINSVDQIAGSVIDQLTQVLLAP